MQRVLFERLGSQCRYFRRRQVQHVQEQQEIQKIQLLHRTLSFFGESEYVMSVLYAHFVLSTS